MIDDKQFLLPPDRNETAVLVKVGFVLACLILPVVWGVVVNWLFEFWRNRSEEKRDTDSIFPDYQI
jgi:heme/copper-type cytochrome/quinol oxidase subunit 2